MRLYLLLLIAACGRFGFDAGTQDAGDGQVGVPDATGSAGPRWAKVVANNTQGLPLAGANGAVVLPLGFQGSIDAVGQTVTGVAAFFSTVVVRFDPTGAVTARTVLDSSAVCDFRGVAMRGDTALIAGLTAGNGQAGLGPCSLSTGRQDPYVIAVDPAGMASLVAHGTASGANAQAWNVVALPDDTFVTAGVYAMGLAFGPTQLPAGQADPNAWIGRFSDGQAQPVWSAGLVNANEVTPGPMATEDLDVCLIAGYGSNLTAFGTPLTNAGSLDELVARLDPSGTPRFVRQVGSPAKESDFNKGSIVAQGGGCVATFLVTGDVTLDGTPLPASNGLQLVAWFDGTGAFTGGFRMTPTPLLAAVNGRLVAAYDVSAPVTIGGTTYTPQGSDVIVVELSPAGPTKLLGAVSGAGDQSLLSLAAIAPDAVAIGLSSSGELVFGSTTLTTALNDRVVAVLGI